MKHTKSALFLLLCAACIAPIDSFADFEQKHELRKSGIDAILAGDETKGIALLKEGSIGERDSTEFRLKYCKSLVRAARRLVESDQYDRAVALAQTALTELNTVLGTLGADEIGAKTRCYYLKGYLYKRVLFDDAGAYRELKAGFDLDPEDTSINRAMERIPKQLRD